MRKDQKKNTKLISRKFILGKKKIPQISLEMGKKTMQL